MAESVVIGLVQLLYRVVCICMAYFWAIMKIDMYHVLILHSSTDLHRRRSKQEVQHAVVRAPSAKNHDHEPVCPRQRRQQRCESQQNATAAKIGHKRIAPKINIRYLYRHVSDYIIQKLIFFNRN